MPEIAEVETVRSILKKQILNKKITDIKVNYAKTILNADLNTFFKLIGSEFTDIKRRGKYLIFETKDNYLISHLRMEGKFNLIKEDIPISKHDHVIFYFEDNSNLRYNDTRKFGRMELINKDELDSYPSLSKLGIEPNEKELTKEYLYNKIKGSNTAIKTLLLDQTIICGLGNIYANEVLFDSGINPTIKGKDLTINDAEKIILSTNKIIKEAIKNGGTTIHSFTSSYGVMGHFQDKLKVHGRVKLPCLNCQTPIVKIKVNGRGTYYCPNCQKNK